ncbi:hypothetical protein, partial [Cupriavidus lacunae]|uniref:hypothetical protein n=1 Tax=Cupriavidus lacunae TaxID=2666307 RepID=UPI001ABF070D
AISRAAPEIWLRRFMIDSLANEYRDDSSTIGPARLGVQRHVAVVIAYTPGDRGSFPLRD